MSSHPVDHCRLEMVLGTTVTCVMMESKLLLMQSTFTVVYSGEWDADGDYCGMWQANQWSTAEVVMVLWTTVTSITSTVDYWGCKMDLQWFTLKSTMPKETTVTCVRPHS